MKSILTIISAFLLIINSFAQSPEKMSYQAVIRNSSNNLVANSEVGMQISILQGSIGGTAVYVETQTPTTNANGLVSLEIGAGTVQSGDFSTIDWTNGPYFIKTETDPVGGTTYTITGISQLLSVPYALHAKTAETLTGGIVESDPVYSNSEAANITATDIANLGNLAGTNTGDQDISGIAANTLAIQDTAAKIRADMPDVSSFLTNESDPVYSNSEAANITATDIANLGNLAGTNTGDQDISGIAANTLAIQDTAAQIRADMPDVSSFLTNESDPVYSNSEAANITAADIANLGNLSGTNTGDQDISGIAANTLAIQDTAAKIRADIPDVSSFLSEEIDPVFNNSVAKGITQSDTALWNSKNDFSGSYNDLTDTPTIPENVSELTNDAGYITQFPDSFVLKSPNGTLCKLFVHDNGDLVTSIIKEADIHFFISRGNLRSSELKSQDIGDLEASIANVANSTNKEIMNIEIKAYTCPFESPDQSTDLALVTQREASARKYIDYQLDRNSIVYTDDLFTSSAIREDWEGFKKLVENSNIQDKELVLSVLSMYSDSEVRKTEIRDLSNAYTDIENEILPVLRRVDFVLRIDTTY
ncbi:MAG: hypothetical protein ACOC0C_07115 [Bacteroidota bacterium]